MVIVAHDFNGDGKLDLAVAGFPPGSSGPASAISIMLGNGDGTFAPLVEYAVSRDRGPTSIAAGDLTGKSKTDLGITMFACAFGLCTSVTSMPLGNGDGTIVWGTDPSLVADLTFSGSRTAGGTLHIQGAFEAAGPVGEFKISRMHGGLLVPVFVPEG